MIADALGDMLHRGVGRSVRRSFVSIVSLMRVCQCLQKRILIFLGDRAIVKGSSSRSRAERCAFRSGIEPTGCCGLLCQDTHLGPCRDG